MTRYSVKPRDRIFVKGYGFLSFAKNIGKNIDKNISKNLSSKHSQKCLDHAKKLQQTCLKLLQKESLKKTEVATGDLIGNKIAKQIARASKTSPKINSETNEE